MKFLKKLYFVFSRFLLFVFILIALVPLWWITAYPRGVLMGEFDSLVGIYGVYAGIPRHWGKEYMRLLYEKYKVKIYAIGDILMQPDEWYINGYNGVMRRKLKRKYKKDIFAECKKEVLINLTKKRAELKKKQYTKGKM